VAIAANAMRDHLDEAQHALQSYLRIDPQVHIATVCGYYPLRRETDRQRLILAMRKAGVTDQAR
jgi:hypothetical protein